MHSGSSTKQSPLRETDALTPAEDCRISRALRRGGTLSLGEAALCMQPLVLSHGVLAKEIAKAVEVLSSLKTDWRERQTCLERLARIVLGWDACAPSQDDLMKFDRELTRPLVTQVKDDRTAIVKHMSMLCIVFGASAYASHLSAHLLPAMIEPLLKQCTVTVAVIAESATQAIRGLSGCGCRKVLETIIKQHKHVHPVARRRVLEIVAAQLCATCEQSGLRDNSPPVRRAARLALCRLCYLGCSPDTAKTLWHSMDVAQQKTAEDLLEAGHGVLFSEGAFGEECPHGDFNRSIAASSRSPRPIEAEEVLSMNSSPSPALSPSASRGHPRISCDTPSKPISRRSPRQSSTRLSVSSLETPHRGPASGKRSANASRSPGLRPSLPKSPASTTVSPEEIISSHLTSLEAEPDDPLTLASLADFFTSGKCSATDVIPVLDRLVAVIASNGEHSPESRALSAALVKLLAGHSTQQRELLRALIRGEARLDPVLTSSFPVPLAIEEFAKTLAAESLEAIVKVMELLGDAQYLLEGLPSQRPPVISLLEKLSICLLEHGDILGQVAAAGVTQLLGSEDRPDILEVLRKELSPLEWNQLVRVCPHLDRRPRSSTSKASSGESGLSVIARLLKADRDNEKLEQDLLEAAQLIMSPAVNPMRFVLSRFARLLMLVFGLMGHSTMTEQNCKNSNNTKAAAFELLLAMLEVKPELFTDYVEVTISTIAHFISQQGVLEDPQLTSGMLDVGFEQSFFIDKLRTALSALMRVSNEPKRSLEALLAWLGATKSTIFGPLMMADIFVNVARDMEEGALSAYYGTVAPVLATIIDGEVAPEVNEEAVRLLGRLSGRGGHHEESESSSSSSRGMMRVPTWITAISDMLDRLVMVLLRDDRKLIGWLKTYDQYGNIVLNDTVERHIVEGVYADIGLGVMIIRGENIILFGEVHSLDMEPALRRAPLGQVLAMEQMQEEREAMEGKLDLAFLDDDL
ncbi:SM-like, degradation of cytoplasmic mRNAs and positively regulates transcription initiation [Perkinsus chesapeaki]|uniref:SM-like, degradation of cytoplasmic mRNAs and positively regulates transcription initiation n=1 Tax=Perkinsus chesapeaki TaxID=330153 RepID=A0A7J6L8M3_PERCH|nr:SM-like, degradation of cytoplasmic mRNAs and positively regulates transcription initiation [Perkinsus chesapeaki]